MQVNEGAHLARRRELRRFSGPLLETRKQDRMIIEYAGLRNIPLTFVVLKFFFSDETYLFKILVALPCYSSSL